MHSSPIVLLTDFGDSPYPGIMRGVIHSINPEVRIIDLYHGITPQSVKEAAFVLAGSYTYFPKGSVFICVIDPSVGTDRDIIILKAYAHTFIAPDNGLLSKVMDTENLKQVTAVTDTGYFLKEISRTFHGRDIFAPVGAHLSRGIKPEQFGPLKEDIRRINIGECSFSVDGITGEIVFIDRFGNLITNIPSTRLPLDKAKTAGVILGTQEIGCIKNNYSDSAEGELTALVSSFGYLEIALRNGSAAKKTGASPGDAVSLHYPR